MIPSASDEDVTTWRVKWWLLKQFIRHLPDEAAWWIARRLPRKIALYAFVRVYGATGGVTATYDQAYRHWESVTNLKRIERKIRWRIGWR